MILAEEHIVDDIGKEFMEIIDGPETTAFVRKSRIELSITNIKPLTSTRDTADSKHVCSNEVVVDWSHGKQASTNSDLSSMENK